MKDYKIDTQITTKHQLGKKPKTPTPAKGKGPEGGGNPTRVQNSLFWCKILKKNVILHLWILSNCCLRLLAIRVLHILLDMQKYLFIGI